MTTLMTKGVDIPIPKPNPVNDNWHKSWDKEDDRLIERYITAQKFRPGHVMAAFINQALMLMADGSRVPFCTDVVFVLLDWEGGQSEQLYHEIDENRRYFGAGIKTHTGECDLYNPEDHKYDTGMRRVLRWKIDPELFRTFRGAEDKLNKIRQDAEQAEWDDKYNGYKACHDS